MKLIFSLTLIYALCSSAAALQCDACADAACSTTFSKNCSSGTLCVTASITASSPGASGTRVYKDCAAPSLCPMAGAATFSVNLGYSSAIASAQCCNSDNCNSQTLAFPTPPSANGLTCPGCDPPTSQCSSTVQCSGDQTSCFQATLTNGSTSYPALGCVSPNTCAAATGLGKLPFMENVGDITAGPVCSAATSITTTAQPTTSTTQATTTAATAPATSSTSVISEATTVAASTSTTPGTTTVATSTSTIWKFLCSTIKNKPEMLFHFQNEAAFVDSKLKRKSNPPKSLFLFLLHQCLFCHLIRMIKKMGGCLGCGAGLPWGVLAHTWGRGGGMPRTPGW
ncbi:uncharacterized protein LOC144992582 [Oryzias latipes]